MEIALAIYLVNFLLLFIHGWPNVKSVTTIIFMFILSFFGLLIFPLFVPFMLSIILFPSATSLENLRYKRDMRRDWTN